MDKLNQVVVPIYELDKDGYIIPNPIFHRSWDKFHSRCIEYPFAASQLGKSKKILDVGTVKSDLVWIKWLESLPIEVHTTDFDLPPQPYSKINFHQGDLRELSIDSNTFDRVLAVSVIEHIGMEDPQVVAKELPFSEKDGDLKAVRELVRVLKPGGKLVMTLPFGRMDGVVLDKSTRIYNVESIKKFEDEATLVSLDYYEYQFSKFRNTYPEYGSVRRDAGANQETKIPVPQNLQPHHYGLVTWRRIPIEYANATHFNHADGVVCGVWIKNLEK